MNLWYFTTNRQIFQKLKFDKTQNVSIKSKVYSINKSLCISENEMEEVVKYIHYLI